MYSTKISLRTALFATIVIASFNFASADEVKNSVQSASGIEWNGYFDFYYQFSPQAHALTPATTSGPEVLEGRYFDRQANQMTLNMAEISLKKKVGKISFRTDVAFGEMVDQLSGGGSQSVTGLNPTNAAANEPTRNLTQATVTYNANDRLSLTAGKFYTNMGLEVTKAKDNWQYSRSNTFNYAIPLWHEGISATYAVVPNKFNATLYLYNAWDGRISQEQNHSATSAANLNFTGVEGLIANYNYIGGAERNDGSLREVHEVNLIYAMSPTLSFATDYVLGTQKNNPALADAKWSGLSVYFKAALNSFYSISPRYELFDDADGFAINGGLTTLGTAQKIMSWTLSNNFNFDDGIEGRFEIRSDRSDSNTFYKDKDGVSPTDHQESYNLALLYSF